ncbi:hypothetical protein KO516_19615 [Citreicella sp. C3M06]|uniref:calcium-binding protein n=1 Tax=Citreicella sp. C3M06 TaxID=2841564 RepID=UPI001C08747A|nr:calcium-binding protein [Citreicella sp. C3M06]MBU2962996.1 hypothetical protein [Citreicella sp. C3M06]
MPSQQFLRLEGDSLMAGASGVSLAAEISALVGPYGVVSTAVGSSTMQGVADRITSPEDSDLLSGVTVIWDGSWNGLRFSNGAYDIDGYLAELQSAIDAIGHSRFVILPPILPYGSPTSSGTGSLAATIASQMAARWPGHVIDWTQALPLDAERLPAETYVAAPMDLWHISQSAAESVARLILQDLADRGWYEAALPSDTADHIVGGPRADLVEAGAGADLVWGNEGDDTLVGGEGADSLLGNAGRDLLLGNTQSDRLYGGLGDDTLRGGNGADRSWLGDGDDLYSDTQQGGVYGADMAWGGAGDDTLHGGGGDDTLYGDHGDDSIMGGVGNDELWGGDGDDSLRGGEGADRAWLGSGDDLYTDSAQPGPEGADYVWGGAGNDSIFGGGGDDTLHGSSGEDMLVGGAGDDLLWGGTGADRFVFSSGSGSDTIRDFSIHEDTIEIYGTPLSEISEIPGELGVTLVTDQFSILLVGLTPEDTSWIWTS